MSATEAELFADIGQLQALSGQNQPAALVEQRWAELQVAEIQVRVPHCGVATLGISIG